jgi:D-tyrosyl-tRNA(Tyr) deacylase
VRAVIQRVQRASVSIDGAVVGSISRGLLILVGVAQGDDASTAAKVAAKCADMRLFPDEEGRFDRSLIEIGGEALVVSQFTLLADVRRDGGPALSPRQRRRWRSRCATRLSKNCGGSA